MTALQALDHPLIKTYEKKNQGNLEIRSIALSDIPIRM